LSFKSLPAAVEKVRYNNQSLEVAMEDPEETFVFSVDWLDVDMRFQTEQPGLLDDDDIRLLTSLEDEPHSGTD
jgi:hypothetical protein